MKTISVHTMSYCALSAAIMCILGPMSISIGIIPLSFTNLVIYISIFVIGTKNTVISYLTYMLLGIFGLPVFSGYSGGVAKILGPTGGYIIGFIFMALICGYFKNKFKNKVIIILGFIIATFVAYIFGTAYFVFSSNSSIKYAIAVCVAPFIIGDIIKILISIYVGQAMNKRIIKNFNE